MGDLAQRIKAWRHALGLTQDEFARRAGIPKRTLVGYENSEREPGSSALAAIAKTGVNMTWLLTGEGEMLPAAAERGPRQGLSVPEKHQRRWRAVMELVYGLEDEAAIEHALDKLYALSLDEAEKAELKRALTRLMAERGSKTAG
jgi:transcriptional regulator with XRE-family HTH domain